MQSVNWGVLLKIFQLECNYFFQVVFTTFQLLPEVTSKTIGWLWASMVKTPLLLLRTLQTKLLYSRSGRVVFISSIMGNQGSFDGELFISKQKELNYLVKAYIKRWLVGIANSLCYLGQGPIETREWIRTLVKLDCSCIKKEEKYQLGLMW